MIKSKTSHGQLSTFGLPGQGIETRFFKTAAEAVREVKRAHKSGFPVLPAGEGSNCVFLEATVPAVFLKSKNAALKGVRKGKTVIVTVGAAYSWDQFVQFAVKQGWAGVERLSGIPGTVGAAPVQNIGAYGASLSDVLEFVQGVNLKTLKPVKLSKKACSFGYRSSMFNGAHQGEFLITSVTVKLQLAGIPDVSDHEELKRMLAGTTPSLRDVRDAVLAIRKRKLPDWRTLPNCGSFFKNPIVDKKMAKLILKKGAQAPHWSEKAGNVKFSAAWLIEKSGVRDESWGKISLSPQHALVLVNRGEKNHEKLREAILAIITAVDRKFGIILQPEPNFLTARYAKEFARVQF